MNPAPLPSLLFQALERIGPLTPDERRAVLDALVAMLRLPAHADLVAQNEAPQAVHVMLEGFACGYKLLADGRRQIVSYCVPGDLCNVRTLMLARMDHSLGTLTSVLVAQLSKDRLLAATERYPRLQRALWRATLIEQGIAREWLVNVGQRTAFARAAHLLCEMFHRLRAVALVQDNSCELPLTQTEIADTLALSTVHVNRTLMELRRAGLITLRDRQLTIHDLPALEAAGAFDPAYLQLEAPHDDTPGPGA